MILLALRAAAAATDAANQKKIFGSGMIPLIILNEEIDDIVKIIKSLEESGLLIGGFPGMLVSTLRASLLRNQTYYQVKE